MALSMQKEVSIDVLFAIRFFPILVGALLIFPDPTRSPTLKLCTSEPVSFNNPIFTFSVVQLRFNRLAFVVTVYVLVGWLTDDMQGALNPL